jgi:hypothetical protein
MVEFKANALQTPSHLEHTFFKRQLHDKPTPSSLLLHGEDIQQSDKHDTTSSFSCMWLLPKQQHLGSLHQNRHEHLPIPPWKYMLHDVVAS